MKIYALLDKNTALGFRLAGVEVKEVETNQEIKSLLPQVLSLSDLGILLISSDLADFVSEEINAHLYSGKFPIIIPLPPLGKEEKAAKSIEALIKESIGISV